MLAKRLTIAFVVVTFLFASSAVLADTVVGGGSAGWQSWTAANLNENGSPYWDNTSADGLQKNIGYCLTATGGCTTLGVNAPGAISFWGNSFNSGGDTGGTADPSFYFTGGTSSDATVMITIAGNAGINQFGWYEVGTGTQHVLFNGGTAGASVMFTPTTSYGFFITGANGTWFTQSGLNPNGQTSDQHFAVFSSDQSTYWIGAEDLPFRLSDKDYNDIVVKITPIPEPATLVMFGSGLLGLAGVVRRKLRS